MRRLYSRRVEEHQWSPWVTKIKGLENVSSNEEACKAELNKKRYLNSLNLEWSSTSRNLHPSEFYGTDDVAFPSLSVLEFDDFPRLHEWSGIADRNSFPCLERLMLMDCPELIQIPSFSTTTREVTIERTRLIPYMRLAPLSSSSDVL